MDPPLSDGRPDALGDLQATLQEAFCVIQIIVSHGNPSATRNLDRPQIMREILSRSIRRLHPFVQMSQRILSRIQPPRQNVKKNLLGHASNCQPKPSTATP